jgi:hypothetical protein
MKSQHSYPSLIRTDNVNEANRIAGELGCSFVMLGHGRFTLIDTQDFERVNRTAWHLHSNGYAGGSPIGKKRALLHRFILQLKPGQQADHANGNRLDNRRCNLRISTQSQNLANKEKYLKTGTSKFKGVSYDKVNNKWTAASQLDGKHKHLGRFYTQTEAAIAYDNFARKTWGEFARTNF